jgi:hypothetical protein
VKYRQFSMNFFSDSDDLFFKSPEKVLLDSQTKHYRLRSRLKRFAPSPWSGRYSKNGERREEKRGSTARGPVCGLPVHAAHCIGSRIDFLLVRAVGDGCHVPQVSTPAGAAMRWVRTAK